MVQGGENLALSQKVYIRNMILLFILLRGEFSCTNPEIYVSLGIPCGSKASWPWTQFSSPIFWLAKQLALGERVNQSNFWFKWLLTIFF